MTGYVIIDHITGEVLCNKDEWDGWGYLERDMECHDGCFRLFKTKEAAQKKKLSLEKQFTKNGDEINFEILKVKVNTRTYLTLI